MSLIVILGGLELGISAGKVLFVIFVLLHVGGRRRFSQLGEDVSIVLFGVMMLLWLLEGILTGLIGTRSGELSSELVRAAVASRALLGVSVWGFAAVYLFWLLPRHTERRKK